MGRLVNNPSHSTLRRPLLSSLVSLNHLSFPEPSPPTVTSLSDTGSFTPNSPSSCTSQESNDNLISPTSIGLTDLLLEECPVTERRDGDMNMREMPAHQIMDQIIQHGCKDMRSRLDLSFCQDVPIATGGFGDIYRGKLHDGTTVAIKCVRLMINQTDEARETLKRISQELYVWSRCEHPNVLRLLGVAQYRKQLAMVSPWVHGNSLRRFLSSSPPSHYDRFRLSCQIAEGLAHLHEKGIIHGDLKAANILMAEDQKVVLADFGNLTLRDHSVQANNSTTINDLSICWVAPEILQGQGTPTTPSDVYSLGMTILEIFTGSEPYAGLNSLAVLRSIMTGRLPERPESHMPTGDTLSDLLWPLLLDCWSFDPRDRPGSMDVCGKMFNLGNELG